MTQYPPPNPMNYQTPTGPVPPFDPQQVQSTRTTAGILGILLGGFGVHRFYLGDTVGGILRILLCFLPFGLIEGIIYLTKTNEQFYQEYMVQRKGWF